MTVLGQTFNKIKKNLFDISAKQWIYIVLICIVSLLLATKGIRDEGTVSLQGDMPRYMMNGVYFYDLTRDLPFLNIIDYTLQYFARYPALSLGQHPLLPGIVQVPFYSIFGISVFSARLMTVFFMAANKSKTYSCILLKYLASNFEFV